jgi:hypothetical protein
VWRGDLDDAAPLHVRCSSSYNATLTLEWRAYVVDYE